MKEIKFLKLPNGNVPFEAWANKLPAKTRIKVLDYIKRAAEGGSKKNIKPLGDQLFEIKIDYKAGFRVYFGELDNVLLLILLGGTKSTQKRDIQKAKRYWRQYVL